MIWFGDTKLPARFWSKVEHLADGCWQWTAGKAKGGYGRFKIGASNELAHRVAYSALVGPIEPGLTIDHLCRNRACVNPNHLEPVTLRVNTLRGDTITAANANKTECSRGHALTGDNVETYERRPGRFMRRCRTCRVGPLAVRSAA